MVPSFAKPAKLGQPLSPMRGQETSKMGQLPSANKRKGVPVSTPFPPLTFTSFTTSLENLRFSGGRLHRRPNVRRRPRHDCPLRS